MAALWTRVGVQCQLKDSDPTPNPHWQWAKEFRSHPFQCLQVIMKHFLKLSKGRKTLIYYCWHCLPPFFLCSSLPTFFCTHFFSLGFLLAPISTYCQVLSQSWSVTERCAFTPQLSQRSSQFSELPFTLLHITFIPSSFYTLLYIIFITYWRGSHLTTPFCREEKKLRG